MSWASANRDRTEFSDPESFEARRPTKRHLTFGAGPHRCLGSNLARMNLRIAVEKIVQRLDDIQLEERAEPIPYHIAYNRTPLTVPITFKPDARVKVS